MIKKWLLMAISAVLIWLGVGINQQAYATVDFDSIPLSELRFSYMMNLMFINGYGHG